MAQKIDKDSQMTKIGFDFSTTLIYFMAGLGLLVLVAVVVLGVYTVKRVQDRTKFIYNIKLHPDKIENPYDRHMVRIHRAFSHPEGVSKNDLIKEMGRPDDQQVSMDGLYELLIYRAPECNSFDEILFSGHLKITVETASARVVKIDDDDNLWVLKGYDLPVTQWKDEKSPRV